MIDARKFLSAEDRARVQAAIAEAEERTGVEIVCAIATESGRYDRAEALAGLTGSLAALCALQMWSAGSAGEGTWDPTAAGIGWQCAAVALGFALGNVLASYVHGIRALFCFPSEAAAESERAASHVFLERRIGSAAKRGTVLLYFSLFEHGLVVLADGLPERREHEAFTRALVSLAERELRAKRPVEALLKPIAAIAEEFASPAAGDDLESRRKLSNEVLFYHPRP